MNDVFQVPEMLTLKQVSERTNLSYNYLRALCMQKKIIYVRAGSKYLINFQKFCDYLNGE